VDALKTSQESRLAETIADEWMENARKEVEGTTGQEIFEDLRGMVD
jgi:hypothetical protein